MGYPAFRDWLVPHYYHTIAETEFSMAYVEQYIYNVVTKYVPGDIILWVYVFLWAVFGLAIAYSTISKISKLVFPHITTNSRFYSSLVAFLYVCNYWTIERYLMGQVELLRGYFVFPLVVYIFLLWFYSHKKIRNHIQRDKKQHIKVYLALSFFALSYISLHVSIFAIIVCGCILCVDSIYEYKKSIKNSSNGLKSAMYAFGNLFYTFIPGLIYTVWRLYNSSIKSGFDSVVTSNIGSQNTVVKNFSLSVSQARGAQNQFILGITGAGSWMNNTFSEFEFVESSVGFLRFFIPYFSTIGSGILAIFILWVCFHGIKKHLQNNSGVSRSIHIGFSVIGILSLVFSFGYSVPGVSVIQQLLQYIPGALLYREPGKWYIIFWFVFCVFVYMLLHSASKKFMQICIVSAVSLLAVTNGLFAFFTLASSNIVSFPQIFDDINSYCDAQSDTPKALYLPHETYIQSEYSGLVFIENHMYRSSTCDFIKPEFVTIGSKESIIKTDEFTKKLSNALTDISECNNKTFLELLYSEGVELVFIDTYFYPEYEFIQTCYFQAFDIVYQQNSMTAFIIN